MDSTARGRAPEPAWEPWDYDTWRDTLAPAQAGNRAARDDLGTFLIGWGERHLSHTRIERREDREDIAEEFAAHVTREECAHLSDAGPKGWEPELFVILRNIARDGWRREKKHLQADILEADLPRREEEADPPRLEEILPEDVDPEEIVVRRADAATLRKRVERLTERDRRILHLRFYEGLSTVEIAGRLEIPRGTVARRLHESLARLRRWLTEGEVQP